MFLYKLSNTEKHLFLDLEIYMAMIDGEFNDAEKRMIDLHAVEMRVDHNQYTPEKSIDEVRSSIKRLDTRTKRVFFFELIATVMSDGVYTSDEKTLIENLAVMFDIDNDDIDNAFKTIQMLKNGYENAIAFVEG